MYNNYEGRIEIKMGQWRKEEKCKKKSKIIEKKKLENGRNNEKKE